jgi:hypothetical protein
LTCSIDENEEEDPWEDSRESEEEEEGSEGELTSDPNSLEGLEELVAEAVRIQEEEETELAKTLSSFQALDPQDRATKRRRT